MAKNCNALGIPVGHMVSLQNSSWVQFGSAAVIWIQRFVYASVQFSVPFLSWLLDHFLVFAFILTVLQLLS